MRNSRKRIVVSWLFVVTALTLAGCAPTWSSEPVENQVKLPGTWTAVSESYYGDLPSDGKLPSVTLHADGSADVTNLPMGTLGKRDTYICFKPSSETYTGRATWSAKKTGLMEIKHRLTTVIWANIGVVGDSDWRGLRIAACGTGPMAVMAGPR